MAITYELIASNTLTTSAASVTFSSIPTTYTDLVVRISARSDRASVMNEEIRMRFNNSSASNYGHTALWGDGSVATSDFQANQGEIRKMRQATASTATSNTFGNTEIYIPNYLSSARKPIGATGVSESNSASGPILGVTAGLWNLTDAVNRIDILLQVGSFVSGSSFFLYGIKNS